MARPSLPAPTERLPRTWNGAWGDGAAWGDGPHSSEPNRRFTGTADCRSLEGHRHPYCGAQEFQAPRLCGQCPADGTEHVAKDHGLHDVHHSLLPPTLPPWTSGPTTITLAELLSRHQLKYHRSLSSPATGSGPARTILWLSSVFLPSVLRRPARCAFATKGTCRLVSHIAPDGGAVLLCLRPSRHVSALACIAVVDLLAVRVQSLWSARMVERLAAAATLLGLARRKKILFSLVPVSSEKNGELRVQSYRQSSKVNCSCVRPGCILIFGPSLTWRTGSIEIATSFQHSKASGCASTRGLSVVPRHRFHGGGQRPVNLLAR